MGPLGIKRFPRYGLFLVALIALIFHVYSYFAIKQFYSIHLPHYDSIGSYTVMFQIINAYKSAGFTEAFHIAKNFHLSWLQSFFALAGAPFLSPTPQSMQLLNSLCVFLFMMSAYVACRAYGEGEMRAFVLSLMVFLPDTFWNWQGGILDLQRDSAFVLLLSATFFSFFAAAWAPTYRKFIMLGVLSALTVLSRGNALYWLQVIIMPLILGWVFIKRKEIKTHLLKMFAIAAVPFFIIALPNIISTIHDTTQRYLNPYVCYGFANSVGGSLKLYWNMPLKLFFGITLAQGPHWYDASTFWYTAGIAVFLVTGITILTLKRILKFDMNRRLYGLLCGGLWALAATYILLCVVLRWADLPFNEAKHPFYTSLLFFFAAVFAIGVSLKYRTALPRVYQFIVIPVCMLACVLLVGRKISMHTYDNDPPEHVMAASDLAKLFHENEKNGEIAFMWHDTINLDTVNYLIASRGGTRLPDKFFFRSPEGSNLDFAIGIPSGADVSDLKDRLESAIRAKACYVVVNTDKNAYNAGNHHMFIFKHGQEIVDRMLGAQDFTTIYRYDIWGDRPWGGRFAVLKNMKVCGGK